MIRYDLVCEKGHEFDGWFRDSDTYDKQAKRGLVSCTHCGTAKIQKQIMAPGIPSKSNKKSDAPVRMTAGPVDPRAAAMMQMMRDYRKKRPPPLSKKASKSTLFRCCRRMGIDDLKLVVRIATICV
jgi:hypothetical protein